jgi:hypothetical protein
MRRFALIITMVTLGLAFCFWQTNPKTPIALAQSLGYTDDDLAGTYSSQWTGSVVFQDKPLSAMNGPWAMNGKTVADGQGNIWGSYLECYNGYILPTNYKGTYHVNRDGTVKVRVTGDIPNVGSLTMEMDGVICDKGKQARFIGSKIEGFPPNYVGIVAVGTAIRQ